MKTTRAKSASDFALTSETIRTSSKPGMPACGVLAALWIPTDANGKLLRAQLAANINWLKDRGIHGILALGSTGEFPQMTVDERKHALAAIAEFAAPLPVIANISDIRPRAVAELGRCARELCLPAVAIMAPGFYPTRQDDLLAHFLHAADSSGLPIFLYNFPELTGTRIDIETVAAFADRAKMAGIKQSGREFAYHKELIALGREKNYAVFSGADTRLPEAFELGASGCISGLANIAPEFLLHLYRVCREKAPGKIMPAFEQLCAIGSALDRLAFPINIAAGMEARGLHVGAPKALVSPQSQKIHAHIVAELRANFIDWQLAPAVK